jgi:hypothetical protein
VLQRRRRRVDLRRRHGDGVTRQGGDQAGGANWRKQGAAVVGPGSWRRLLKICDSAGTNS